MTANKHTSFLSDGQVQALNAKHGWFKHGDAQSDVSRAFANDAVAAYERVRSAAPELLDAWTMGVELNVPDFLDWIADRLEHVHGENRLYDYMHHLRNIAKAGRAAIAKATGESP